MKAINQFRDHLKKVPVGSPFTANIFRHLATSDNVRQILSRLVKSGEIKRISRGVYIKPKEIPNIGELPPSVVEVAKIIAKSTGETIAVHGAEAARLLQLSTQTPLQSVFYTNGNTRELKIGNRIVNLKHVNPSKLIKPGTTVGLVISALAYLGRENVTLNTIKKIEKQISKKEFDSVVKEVSIMPAWMANLFFKHNKGNNNG